MLLLFSSGGGEFPRSGQLAHLAPMIGRHYLFGVLENGQTSSAETQGSTLCHLPISFG
jgi:hypothetical protein